MNWLRKILDRFTPDTYTQIVKGMEYTGLTFLPDINGKYGPRQMNQRDILGRWSLGWRPDKCSKQSTQL